MQLKSALLRAVVNLDFFQQQSHLTQRRWMLLCLFQLSLSIWSIPDKLFTTNNSTYRLLEVSLIHFFVN